MAAEIRTKAPYPAKPSPPLRSVGRTSGRQQQYRRRCVRNSYSGAMACSFMCSLFIHSLVVAAILTTNVTMVTGSRDGMVFISLSPSIFMSEENRSHAGISRNTRHGVREKTPQTDNKPDARNDESPSDPPNTGEEAATSEKQPEHLTETKDAADDKGEKPAAAPLVASLPADAAPAQSPGGNKGAAATDASGDASIQGAAGLPGLLHEDKPVADITAHSADTGPAHSRAWKEKDAQNAPGQEGTPVVSKMPQETQVVKQADALNTFDTQVGPFFQHGTEPGDAKEGQVKTGKNRVAPSLLRAKKSSGEAASKDPGIPKEIHDSQPEAKEVGSDPSIPVEKEGTQVLLTASRVDSLPDLNQNNKMGPLPASSASVITVTSGEKAPNRIDDPVSSVIIVKPHESKNAHESNTVVIEVEDAMASQKTIAMRQRVATNPGEEKMAVLQPPAQRELQCGKKGDNSPQRSR